MSIRIASRWGLLTIAVLFLLHAAPGHCQEPAIEAVGELGGIDWVQQQVFATGIGVAPADVNPAKARVMAERASLVVARRNLLEVVRGVHIDSRTTVDNFMVQNDTVVAQVSGEVKFSRVERVETLLDGTVRTTVSMPLGGRLSEIILQAAATPAGGAGTGGDTERRLQELETRVRALEERVAVLNRTSLQQQEMIDLFRRFANAWAEYAAARPMIVAADAGTTMEVSALVQRMEKQEARLSEISKRLDDLSRKLEGGAAPAARPATKKVSYTGLVVDARDIGFRPCMKPEMYLGRTLLYPGDGVDMNEAVRRGYVRYYRQVGPAQQSDRVGSLPLTIRAKATYGGDRGLLLDETGADVLKAIAQDPEGFFRECRVVIIF